MITAPDSATIAKRTARDLIGLETGLRTAFCACRGAGVRLLRAGRADFLAVFRRAFVRNAVS
jgi:hypothetical protein